MVKYKPLLVQPMILEVSGIKVIIAPAEKETNNMIQNTGIILGSKTSFHPIRKRDNFQRDFIVGGNVSFIRLKIRMEAKAKTEEM